MSQSGRNTQRMREIALALPDTHEELTWGEEVNFRAGKKIFCFPGDEAMTVKADPDERDALLATRQFRVAAYVGRFDWLTMDLPKKPDWPEIAELITTSYCLVAPKRLASRSARRPSPCPRAAVDGASGAADRRVRPRDASRAPAPAPTPWWS